MFHKLSLALALLPLLLQTGTQPAMQIAFLDTGIAIGYVAFPDGSGISVAYQEQDGAGSGYFSFVLARPDSGSTQVAREAAPYGRPEKVFIGACGRYLHFVANWATGQIYRYRLELPGLAVGCEMHELYLPVVGS